MPICGAAAVLRIESQVIGTGDILVIETGTAYSNERDLLFLDQRTDSVEGMIFVLRLIAPIVEDCVLWEEIESSFIFRIAMLCLDEHIA